MDKCPPKYINNITNWDLFGYFWDATKIRGSLRIMLQANSINVCQLTNIAASSLMKLSISPPANVRTDEFDFRWSGHVPDRLPLMLFCNTRPRYGLRCGSSSDSGENVLTYVLNKTWSKLDLSYLVRQHVHFLKLRLSWTEWKKCIRDALLVLIHGAFA